MSHWTIEVQCLISCEVVTVAVMGASWYLSRLVNGTSADTGTLPGVVDGAVIVPRGAPCWWSEIVLLLSNHDHRPCGYPLVVPSRIPIVIQSVSITTLPARSSSYQPQNHANGQLSAKALRWCRRCPTTLQGGCKVGSAHDCHPKRTFGRTTKVSSS